MTLVNNACTCNPDNQRNMVLNSTDGSCRCEAGFKMTDFGCFSCEYLIPGCKNCTETSTVTSIQTYTHIGSLTTRKYLNCAECDYMKYIVPGNSTEPTTCKNCAQKWDGCSQCGAYGDACTTCYNSHLFTNQTHLGYATDILTPVMTGQDGLSCISVVLRANGEKGTKDVSILNNHCSKKAQAQIDTVIANCLTTISTYGHTISTDQKILIKVPNCSADIITFYKTQGTRLLNQVEEVVFEQV